MKQFFLVLIMLAGSWLAWTSKLAAQNDEDEPVSVGLLSFTANEQPDGVRLDWETATELNTAGFNIQRSTDGTSFVTLNEIGFVISQGGVATGFEYSELDTTAVIGQTYMYKLVEIETNSSQHDLETVTITFDPDPTPTPIFIDGNDSTPKPTTTPAPTSTNAPSATSTATAVATNSRTQPTATPFSTRASQPTATTVSTNSSASSQPTTAPQASPTSFGVLDQAFNNDSNSSVAFAQEEPSPEAYPAPETLPDTPIDADTSYPSGQPETGIAPPNPTPYPANTDVDAQPTITIIGSDDPYPSGSDGSLPVPTAETMRGRIFLWAGFLIALFIFMSGVIGAIVLYRRRPA